MCTVLPFIFRTASPGDLRGAVFRGVGIGSLGATRMNSSLSLRGASARWHRGAGRVGLALEEMSRPTKSWDGWFALKNPKATFSATDLGWGQEGVLDDLGSPGCPWVTPVLRWVLCCKETHLEDSPHTTQNSRNGLGRPCPPDPTSWFQVPLLNGHQPHCAPAQRSLSRPALRSLWHLSTHVSTGVCGQRVAGHGDLAEVRVCGAGSGEESQRRGSWGVCRGVASSLSVLLPLLCVPGQQGSTPASEMTPTHVSPLKTCHPIKGDWKATLCSFPLSSAPGVAAH